MTAQSEATRPTGNIQASPHHARRRPSSMTPYYLLIPAFVFFVVFLVSPALMTLGLSFTKWSGLTLSSIRFVGLQTWRTLLADPTFWLSLRNTALYVVGVTLFLNLAGFTLALLAATRVRGAGFLRNAAFIPILLSTSIVGILWRLIVSPQGLLNMALLRLGVIREPRVWLMDPLFALGVSMVATTWQTYAFNMVIYYAGLCGLPRELLDAASVDGCTSWQLVWHIILPLMWPVASVVVLFNLIAGWQTFEVVWLISRGQPADLTHTLATWMYKVAWVYMGNMGYASAVAIVIALLSLVTSWIRMKVAAVSIEY